MTTSASTPTRSPSTIPTATAHGRISESVRSDESVLVPWPFPPLTSRERAGRCVCGSVTPAVVARRGASRSTSRSPCSSRRTGSAVPITADGVGENPERPVRFRRELRRARRPSTGPALCVRARRAHDVAQRVARRRRGARSRLDQLRTSPPLPHLRRHIGLLAAGPNVIGMTVAEGWYRGRLGFRGGRRAVYGDRHRADRPARARATTTARVETIATGTRLAGASADWRLSASLYDGESADGRLAEPDWATPGFDDATGWPCVSCATRSPTTLIAAEQPARASDRDAACRVRTASAPSGAAIVDFGQNISGRVRFRVRGRPGTRSPCATPRCSRTASSASWLSAHRGGDRPLRPAPVARRRATSRSSRSTGSSTPGSTAGPASSTPARSRPSSATRTWSRPAPSTVPHDGLNRLHDNVRWSMRGNFVDVPTDCPQRDERLGWTGDIQVFAPAATFLYDCCRACSSRGWTTSPPSSARSAPSRPTCPGCS